MGGLSHSPVQKIELFIGAFIGAITFTASVIAYGKLSGRFGSRAINFKGQHLAQSAAGHYHGRFRLRYSATGSHAGLPGHVAVRWCWALPDYSDRRCRQPVVVSMLNSYSGWAAAGIGFTLNNPVLIIGGACVGSSVRSCPTSCVAP